MTEIEIGEDNCDKTRKYHHTTTIATTTVRREEIHMHITTVD